MDASGSNPNRGKDQRSTFLFQSEEITTGHRPHILLVEDNRADVFLTREAIQQAQVAAELHVVNDGEKAIAFIDRTDTDETAPCPDMVLLDLNIPRRGGAEVLEHLRRSRRCGKALVVIVSSSDSERDRAEASALGADGYFRKPCSYDAFIEIGSVVRDLLGRARAEAEKRTAGD